MPSLRSRPLLRRDRRRRQRRGRLGTLPGARPGRSAGHLARPVIRSQPNLQERLGACRVMPVRARVGWRPARRPVAWPPRCLCWTTR